MMHYGDILIGMKHAEMENASILFLRLGWQKPSTLYGL